MESEFASRDRSSFERSSEEPLAPATSTPGDRPSTLARFGPFGLVAAVIAFIAYEIRADVSVVAYVNDSAMHSELVTFATDQIRKLRLPLTSWFPNLGLGSPEFLHYQSLPAMLTGTLGLVLGAHRAFSLALYVLLSAWPASVYAGGRLFGFDRWQAAAAAVCSPFITSVINIGYEQYSYIWDGYGVWTQLFAMWTLPLAWGFTWQAVHHRRHYLGALVFSALTIACHYETGYLAIAAVIVWPFLSRRGLVARLRRGALVIVGVFAAAAWVVVPLAMNARWAAIDEFLQGTVDANSYGARRVLSWLVEGRIYDDGRWPVLTIAVAFGLVFAIARFRHDVRVRPILAMWLVSLVLFFGRPTLGPLLDVLPGSHDLFIRRFIVGVHLAGLYLAGYGVVEVWRTARAQLVRRSPRLEALPTRPWQRAGAAGALVLVGVVLLAPAWTQIEAEDVQDATNIHYQQAADASVGAEVNRLLARAEALGGGRVYGGLPSNWGASFTVGYAPMYKWLAWDNVDAIGYTSRTASLMSNPEAYFDESNPADYDIFAVRFLILPAGHPVPIAAARLIARAGTFRLYETGVRGYVQVVDSIPGYAENRADIGAQSAWFLYSSLAANGDYPTIGYAGAPSAPATTGAGRPPHGAAGTVLAEHDDLQDGEVSVTIDAHRSAVALLKVSYDPGWTARVDGVATPTEILAPAMVGVRVSAGVHRIVFVYRGYPYYPELAALLVVALALAALADRRRRRELPRRPRGPALG